MVRIPVTSSNLATVGYLADTSILEIEFRSGAIYRYYGVPDTEYQHFMESPSLGSYFHKNIRNSYKYKRVDVVPDEDGERYGKGL